MRKTFSITAVGYSSLLPLLVEAGSFKWNTNTGSEWAPAGETPAAGFHQPLHPDPASAQPPAPTSPPDLRKKEERLLLAAAKRSTTAEAASICGYEDGQADLPLACWSDGSCLFASIDGYSFANCCPTTSLDCPIQTTCVESKVGLSIQLTSSLGDNTLWCGDSTAPYCVTYTYGDVSGYSALWCAQTQTSDILLMDYNPTDVTPTSTATTTPSGGNGNNNNSSNSSSDNNNNNKTSIPVGPIVGGVVGGIAVIAVMVLGLVFLLRNKRKNDDDRDHGATPGPNATHVSMVGGGGGGVGGGDRASQAPPPPGGQNYQYQQIQPIPMQEQQQQYPLVFHDNGQKPPYNVQTQAVYDPMMTVSPSTSPPPQQQQQQQQAPGYHEMPGATGDRNVTELA